MICSFSEFSRPIDANESNKRIELKLINNSDD